MDERHWWIAQQIGHAFKIDLSIQTNNSFMEKFILEPTVLEKVNEFLCMNGANKLFFCCLKDELSERNILVLDSLLKLPKNITTNVDNSIILYFIRHDTNQEISQAYIHKEVYCGELKNISQILFNIYNDLLLPNFKANRDWGNCTEETKTQIIRNMEKYVNTIGTILNDNQNSKNFLLKRADHEILNELKQPRLTTDSPVIKICEELALDWIKTIENILSDICDERFIHPSVGPLSELERWQRKQRLLSSLTEQLKTKECKSIISGLIGVKSKILKKWKTVDTGITDAQNECRDKVKFLESLKRPIDQFYQDVTPQSCINTALPGLCTAMRTIESVSRYYARQGYLGLLFTKVTNQIVNILKEYVSELSILVENEEQFWPIILKEVEENTFHTMKEQNLHSAVSSHSSPDKRSFFSEAKTARSSIKETKEQDILIQNSEGLYVRLRTCLQVQAKYKEAFRALRDGLGGTQALLSFPSVSSLHTSDQSSIKESNRKQSTFRRTANETKNHGILMSEEDIIFNHLDLFCARAKNIIDQMTILSQYQHLAKTSIGLSRPKKEDLGLEYGNIDDENLDDDFDNNNDGDNTSEDLNSDDDLNDAETYNEKNDDNYYYSNGTSNKTKNMDPVVEEEDEEDISRENSPLKKENTKVSIVIDRKASLKKENSNESDTEGKTTKSNENEYRNEAAENLFKTEQRIDEDAQNILKKAQTLSKEDLRVLRKYYNKINEGPTVTAITNEFLGQLINAVKSVTAKNIIDVETKDSTIFDEMHKNFSMIVIGLERFLAAYLNVIFLKEKKTQEGLNILVRFEAVNQRNILRPIINDKYVEMFTNYEKDLETTKITYESMKSNPPLLRNAPPVAGSISWVRQLLKNIEEPIKLFQANKYITNLGDFSRISKKYNKLASILISYETLYLNQWKSSIDEAKLGLKAHLICPDPVTNKLIVNYDQKLLQLFHESKWLKRMDIEIPHQAQELLTQEKKYKEYKSNLEMLFNELDNVQSLMPQHLLPLYEPHIKQTINVCQPGCFILTWSSLNIDAFLKTFEVSINKLRNLVIQVQEIKEKEILDIIININSTLLFDYDLAFSRRYGPEEFTNLLNESITQIADKLTMQIHKIESNIEDIGNLLVVFPKEGSNSTRRKTKCTLNDLIDMEPKLAFLKEHYSVILYESIENNVKRTLQILAIASGYKFDEGEQNLVDLNNDDTIKNLEQILIEKSLNFESDYDDKFKNIYLSTARTKSAVSSTSAGRFDRPLSTISALSKATWSNERKFDESYLNLELVLKYAIPEVVIEPDLNETQKAIKTIAFNCIEVTKRIKWRHPDTNKTFYDSICKNPDTIHILNVFNTLTDDIRPVVKQHINHFKLFDFLWKEDLNTLFNEFMRFEPEEPTIKREIERLVKIEKKVLGIPDYINIGPVCLKTEAVKSSLKSFAFAWKSKYASVMHQLAKAKLQEALVYRENVQKRLSVNVATLEQLNDALRLLEELSDMENKIDKIYLPIENLYDDLRRFDLLLTREEIDQVTTLRERWAELMASAETQRVQLLQEKRSALEQELDKQVKTFVVEVIRFRNAFDAQGPSVASIEPMEAVRRLIDFQKQYDTYDTRRKTLDSISILFGLQCKPFPELDKTGEELILLNLLYKVYQKFLTFDKQFRATLWSEIDLSKSTEEINSFWQEFLELPVKLKENWDAYFDLKNALQKYINVLPILLILNAQEIRNRHWLQVMQVTKSSFQLESAVFKLNDIVDIGLDAHKIEIEEICKAANKEQELEIKMRTIEEEWNEQVLSFVVYKDYGEVCLDKFYTERLLEQLDDAQEILVSMLTSKYIGPLRDEVSSWSEKLKTIGDVLELWIEVQELWINNEAIFTNQSVVKEMPAEAKRFQRVDKSWLRSQKQSYDMKSVIQCCLGSSVQENTKRVLLKDIQKELEICIKSLNVYLEKKRKMFPRFYFLSNSSLLNLLSHPNDITSTRPYLTSLFSAISDIKLEEIRDAEEEKITIVSSASLSDRLKKSAHFSESGSIINNLNTQYEASEVLSADGDVLQLYKKVTIEKNVETWLNRLKETVAESLKRYLISALTELFNNAIPLEELALKYPTQICIVALNYLWTKEAELSIHDIKNDRKAVNVASKKFIQVLSKLLNALTRTKWSSDKPILYIHKLRLESMLTFCTYLKDAFESLANRRVRDVFDFEWQRCFRVYLVDENGLNLYPKLCIMDDSYQYGTEFYGIEQGCVITSLTERCFLSMWQASRLAKGSLISGKSTSGKTQTVKGFAQFMGRYMGYLYCTPQTDQQALGNALQGLAQEGTWGLFDEIQNMNTVCLSWFNEYLTAIIHALRKKTHIAVLGDGKEIPINSHFSLFSTINPFKIDSYTIPIQLRSMFRVICLLEPDIEHIISAKCTHYGIKCGHILATRIKTLHEICQSTFTTFESKSQLTIGSFIEIIRSIYDKQRPTPSESRPETSVSSANPLANKYLTAKGELLTNQLTPLKELSRKNKTALLNYAKNDHVVIAQKIIDVITPRLNSNDAKNFKKIVQDIFVGNSDIRAQQAVHSSQSNYIKSLENVIIEKATNDFNLHPNKNWVEKCLQIYSVSTVYRGIILVGPPCTGKSSTLSVLIESLSDIGRSRSAKRSSFVFKTQNQISATHKLRKVNPLAIDDEAILYGSVQQNGDWKDGLLTYAVKKANRNECTTWLCMDGPIFPNWSDNFNTIIDTGFLQLKNGDRLSTQSKFVFETCDLSNATPSIVAKSGLVYFGDDLVGWRSIAKSWLDNRSQLESQIKEYPCKSNLSFRRIIQCLQRTFNKTMDEVSKYVFVDCKPILPVREEGLFLSCLNLLGAMLSENTNIGGEIHIERLYLYCLIWTFGGVLEANDQKGFSDLLNRLVTALPDDDLKSSVFEYYVDESGEWDLWSVRVPEAVYLDNMDLLGNIFVDTVDTIRCKVFLEFANLAHQNVIVLGNHGCGKTSLIQDYVHEFDANLITAKRLNFSSATNVSQIQKFIEANIVHRQGYTYGAPDKKKLMLFIDDINLPKKDKFGVQRCNEFLRQVVDNKFIYGSSKPFETKKLENIALYATMTIDKNSKNKLIDSRLLRHFVMINLPNPKGQALKSIFNGVLEATLLYNEREFIEADLHAAIVDASCLLLEQVIDVLKPCPTPGREHYLFNMRQIITVLQSLRKLSDTQRADSLTVISLWRHEVLLTILNQMPRLTDQAWLKNTVADIIKDKLQSFIGKNKPISQFITFSLETKTYDRPISALQNRSVKVQYISPLDVIEKARTHIELAFTRYKEEFGYHQINLAISDNVANHIIRIHRILTFSHCGNLLLIGSAGNKLTNLIKLAVYLADIQISPVDCAKTSLFYDSIRASVRAAGSEGRPVALIFTAKDLIDNEYMDTINSLLNNGECLHLFSNDEMDGLYQAVGPSIKREYPNIVVDPKKFFNTRVKKNLHICLSITPHSKIFSQIVREYTGILNNCQIYWISDWDVESLLIEAKYFMKDRLESEDLRNKISQSMCDIHFYMLKECRQIPWAGSFDKEIKIQQTKTIEKKKEQIIKTITTSIPNYPYSKNILQEQIKLEHVPSREKSKLHFFIGPNTYKKFMNSFWYFFTTKAKQCENDIIRLRRVLDTLNKTRNDSKEMKVYIKDLRARCKQAEIDSEEFLHKLVEKTTAVEKLKAKFGRGGSLATLMQMHEDVNDNYDLENEQRLLLDEELDEYDREFVRMKEESLKSKQTKLQDELEQAKHAVEDCKRALSDKRKQAEYWRNKVDRPCVERIRAFQNPPALIGQIMDMTMIMIGKRRAVPYDKVDSTSVANTSREKDDQNSTKISNFDLRAKPKPSNNKMERLDKTQWKQYQVVMQDAVKFVEMLHDINLEDGLFLDVNQAVESYLAKGKDGQLGITGEGYLLDNAKDINIPANKGSDTDFKGITIAAARYASEDAATLVHYVIAVVEYTRQCGPLRQAKERVEIIKAEMADYERKRQERESEILRLKQLEASLDQDQNIKSSIDDSYNETDLPRLLDELQDLQDKFDSAAVKKHKLHIELEGCIQRLEAATAIVQSPNIDSIQYNPELVSLTNLEEQWKKWIDEHLSHEQTLTNCLIAAAYVTYTAPFDRDLRQKLSKFFVTVCQKFDIPKEPQQLFKDLTLAQFLYTPIQLKELQLLRLPDTENMLENGCFIIEDKAYDNWPIFCDPSRRSIDWIKTYCNNKSLFIVRHSELKSILETCLSEGNSLLLTDCNVNTIMNNPKLEMVIKNKHRFMNSEKPFKLNLGSQEVECKPTFRLFLHTIYDAIELPIELAAYSTVITYTLTRGDVEEEMLDRFMLLAKPRIDSERYALLQEKVDTLKIIDPLEQDITDFLASDVNLLQSVDLTKKLSDLKKMYDEAVDSNLRIESAEESLIKTRESYREIAQRASVCYDVIASLKEINSNYILSYHQFTELFDDSLYQFERSSIPQVVNKFTFSTFQKVSQMINEFDKKIYAILLAMEIEAASNRVNPGEKEFIIAPLYGAAVMQSLTGKQMNEHKYYQSKKPFDWMSDDQFANLQILAIYFNWFSDVFDRMSKDGRETQWRTLCESEIPENGVLPDKLDEQYTPTQRLCVIRAVRGDRILQASFCYITTVLGKSYISSVNIDIESLYQHSSSTKPIVLMYLDEPESVRRCFLNYVKTKDKQPFTIIDINGVGSGEEKNIKKLMAKPIEEGSWVLLHNCQNAPQLLNQIETIIYDNQKALNQNFRCWISLLQSDNIPPSSLMLNSVKGLISPPVTMKENMVRAFSWVDHEFCKTSSKSEWTGLLHNICYLHSCLKLRSRYPRCGWNMPYSLHFTTEELIESFKAAAKEFSLGDLPSRSESAKTASETSRGTSWTAIRYIISDLIYGSLASDDYDLESIQCICEYWLSTSAVKKDFELSKLKYKIPPQFFVQSPKLSNLQQALENIPHLLLELPEACHLLPSTETVLGDDLYVMIRLNKLIDALPSSKSNVKLFDRPITPFDAPNMIAVSPSSTNPLLSSSTIFSSANFAALQNKKFGELSDYCSTLLAKMPKGFTKDQINDKVKKSGGISIYNTWISNELNQLCNVINTIKNHLTIIKNATADMKTLGCNWDEEVIEVADSLYYQRIPDLWCHLSGVKYGFQHYGIATFISDLSSRFSHLDKCVTMGRDKNPAYNLSAFFNPQALLGLFKLETLRIKNQNDDTFCVESLVFQSEMTARDKEHLRDPPKEGIFVYGLYLWGCHFEKSTSELIDQTPKNKESCVGLPVMHLTCWPESEKPFLNDPNKSQDLYACPVYMARNKRDEVVFHIDMWHSGVPASRWSMRGVCATLKPY